MDIGQRKGVQVRYKKDDTFANRRNMIENVCVWGEGEGCTSEVENIILKKVNFGSPKFV